jgi:CBS domain-containing protein
VDEAQRRRLFRLIAGVLVADRQLGGPEDVFLARLCAELELPQSERQTLSPMSNPAEAARAMGTLPEEVRLEAFERVMDAAVVDVVVAAAERRYLLALGEAIGMTGSDVDARLTARGLAIPEGDAPAAIAPTAAIAAPPTVPPSSASVTRVADVMTPDPMVVEPSVTLEGAYSTMKSLGFRHLPVVLDGKLVGILSTNDIGRLGATVPSIMLREVGSVMTPQPLTIRPEEPIEAAAATMALRKVSCLLVVSDGALVGIVTTYDLLDALARRLRTGK